MFFLYNNNKEIKNGGDNVDELTLKENPALTKEELWTLYTAVGWHNEEHHINAVMEGIKHSYVLAAYEQEKLVGFLRAVSDQATICLVQEVVIDPAHSEEPIKEQLMRRLIQRWNNIEQIVLVADRRDETQTFYEQCGFRTFQEMNACGFIRDVGL